MRAFIILLCLIPFFSLISNLQVLYSFNSIPLYLISILFIYVSLKLFLNNRPIWLNTKTDKLVYFLFYIFTFYLVIQSVRFEVFYLQEFFVGELFLLPYLLPIFMLSISIKPHTFKFYISIIKKLLFPGFIALILIIANLNFEYWLIHVRFFEIFLFGFPLIFLLNRFINNKIVKILLYTTLILVLFIVSYYGRRSIVFDYTLIFLFFLFIQIASRKNSKITLAIQFICLSVLVFFIFVFFSEDILQLGIFQRGINIEAWELSRGAVVADFFEDFNSITDWVWGRGLNGTVKRSIDFANNSGEGNLIENGYLQLVLKGGNVYFFFILYFFLKAFYLGWFNTRNDFTKAFAALLLIHLLGMIAFNIPIFSHRYMLNWLSIPICFSTYYRGLTNKQVSDLIIPK
jgi:hypothetical protein